MQKSPGVQHIRLEISWKVEEAPFGVHPLLRVAVIKEVSATVGDLEAVTRLTTMNIQSALAVLLTLSFSVDAQYQQDYLPVSNGGVTQYFL